MRVSTIYLWILAAIIYADIEVMYFWVPKLGLAERIACSILLLVHVVLFFILCGWRIVRENKESDTNGK